LALFCGGFLSNSIPLFQFELYCWYAESKRGYAIAFDNEERK
jgi:hypothetical protein